MVNEMDIFMFNRLGEEFKHLITAVYESNDEVIGRQFHYLMQLYTNSVKDPESKNTPVKRLARDESRNTVLEFVEELDKEDYQESLDELPF